MIPTGVLMCRPTHFDVLDRKNPFMDPANAIDAALALQEWSAVADAFARSGMSVVELQPAAGCEDMVFTANPAFTGRDRQGRLRAVASRMRFPTRTPEVAPQTIALRNLGYEIFDEPGTAFEGGGDAVWHLGRHTIYLGIGPRTSIGAARALERAFDAEVVPIRLVTERYYHLDTAFCAIDQTTALVHPAAIDASSYDEIARRFEHLIDIPEEEALAMACNAARAGGNTVVIDESAAATARHLRDLGYTVAAVPTSQFKKSGGSVYCMKQYLF